MRVVRVLIAHVLRQIGLRLAIEQIRQIEGDRLTQTRRRLARQRSSGLRYGPDEEYRLHDEHRGEKRNHAERDSPVQTAVPLHPPKKS